MRYIMYIFLGRECFDCEAYAGKLCTIGKSLIKVQRMVVVQVVFIFQGEGRVYCVGMNPVVRAASYAYIYNVV